MKRRFAGAFIRGTIALFMLVLGTVGLEAQPDDICQEPADKPFRACLSEIARYTTWMVTPGADVARGELQQALDDVYRSVQEEWTGPLRARTYLKWIYVLIPSVVLLYVVAVFWAPKIFPPLLPPGEQPKWTGEKLVIVLGSLAAMTVLVGERIVTYRSMNAQYALIPEAIGRFVHLRPPAELASATVNPCEVVFKNSDLLLGLCSEDWARQARMSLARLIHSTFAKPSLLQSPIAIGSACQKVSRVPQWWDPAGQAEPGERVMKLDCQVYQSGSSSVSGRDLAVLAELPKWLSGSGPTVPALKLENAFRVQTAGGGSDVYREKVQALVGSDSYRGYREQYQRASWRWIGSTVGFLFAITVFLYFSRQQELVGGSSQWGQVRRALLFILICLSFASIVGSVSLITLS